MIFDIGAWIDCASNKVLEVYILLYSNNLLLVLYIYRYMMKTVLYSINTGPPVGSCRAAA